MVELRITGADQLKRLGAEFKAAGAGDLRKDMLRDFRAEARPLIEEIREGAEILPRRGGLGRRVARSKIRASNRLTGSSVGMRITGTNSISLQRLDAGTVRHPLYGNRNFWFTESVTPGWFDKPFKRGVDDLRRRIVATMDRYATKLGSR